MGDTHRLTDFDGYKVLMKNYINYGSNPTPLEKCHQIDLPWVVNLCSCVSSTSFTALVFNSVQNIYMYNTAEYLI